MRKTQLVERWKDLIEAEGAPEILGEGKQALVAKIFENQQNDIVTNAVYKDNELNEAFAGLLSESVIAGDHGYNATNIAAGSTTGAVTNVGPAVMGMVRRSIPNLIAFDIAGVQPLSQSTGQIFSLRSTYGKTQDASAKEAFHPMYAPDAMHSGKGATVAAKAFKQVKANLDVQKGDVVKHTFVETGIAYLQAVEAFTVDASATDAAKLDEEVVKHMTEGKLAEISEGMATSIAELQEGFNGSTDNPWNEMGFRIDKQTIEARSRQLKASYSIELAQDLRAVHGLDADSELSSILATEIMLEINRELVNWINFTAQVGKSGMTKTTGTKAGVFDLQDTLDVRGARWAGESFKALLFQIDKEAAEIGRQTGRGAGNFIIASRNVVNILASVDTNVSGAAHGLASQLNTDTNKAVFAGVLGGRYKVYIDQYARQDYFTVGYKGENEMDAGLYYAPYVALTPLRGQDPKNMQPVLAFKTRYAIGVNPFADPTLQAPDSKIINGMVDVQKTIGKNGYFRRVIVKGA